VKASALNLAGCPSLIHTPFEYSKRNKSVLLSFGNGCVPYADASSSVLHKGLCLSVALAWHGVEGETQGLLGLDGPPSKHQRQQFLFSM
jgi:hypothetical protein